MTDSKYLKIQKLYSDNKQYLVETIEKSEGASLEYMREDSSLEFLAAVVRSIRRHKKKPSKHKST